VHSFCTRGEYFFVAARNFPDESGFSEYVAISKLANDDCGDAGGRLAILEGELPGEIRKRARVRAGCPGIAASSTVRSLSGLGSWLAARVAEK